MSPTAERRIVVLDRDGVINRDSARFIRSAAEWIPLPGSLRAIADLCVAGYSVVVASNQSGIGRGLLGEADLAAIHARMRVAVEAEGGSLAGIFYCPHRPEDGCDCRKPLPGLLRQIEARFGLSLAGKPVIGDSLRDIDAALSVGARAILVRTGNGAMTEHQLDGRSGICIYADLAAAVADILKPGMPG